MVWVWSQDPHGGKERTNTLLKVATDLTYVMWHTHALTHTHITGIHAYMHMTVNEKKTSKSLHWAWWQSIIKHTESWSRKIQNARSTWATQWEALRINKQKKNSGTSYFQNILGHKFWLRQGPKEANDNSKSSRASSLKVMYQVRVMYLSLLTLPGSKEFKPLTISDLAAALFSGSHYALTTFTFLSSSTAFRIAQIHCLLGKAFQWFPWSHYNDHFPLLEKS